MKKFLHIIAMLLFPVLAIAQNKDLPNPVADLQTLPAGSYVIPMDNAKQFNNANDFNLKSYGLLVYLLSHNVKIKWVIRSGKLKDGIDFSANAEKIKPVAVAAANLDFRAGPFVIYAADTTGVSLLIDSFYMKPGGKAPVAPLTGNNRPSIYKTTADVPNVDIRYDLAGFKPKAAILKDGGNEDIHVGYMYAAGIPDTSWRINLGQNLINLCFTFASEPHNDKVGTPLFDTAIHGIRAFVAFGGNFLAQCAAVRSYENHVDHGYLQTNTGVADVNKSYKHTIYSNNDLSFAQYEGLYEPPAQGGSLQTWNILNNWVNNGYPVVNDPQISGGSDNIAASVSKLLNPNIRGGMVFYIGNHNFSSLTAENDINGIRMYMNAFLTPVAINQFCAIPGPLPVSWYSFNATKSGVKVELEWKTATEINNKYFYPERSTDGVNYITLAKIAGAINSSSINAYRFTDQPIGSGIFYYRVRQEDMDGRATYSETRVVKMDGRSGTGIYIYPNPSNGIFTVAFDKANTTNSSMLVFDKIGRQVYRMDQFNKTATQVNLSNLTAGIYTVVLISGSEKITEKIVIVK